MNTRRAATLAVMAASAAIALSAAGEGAAGEGAAAGAAGAAGEGAMRRPAADLARGRSLYATKCATCHGPDGRGDGAAARHLDPPPRDLTRGVYKLRSTPSGALPTDDDLYRTITRGVPGTSMPPWSGLASDDRWQLVYHLKSLSPRFARKGRVRPPVVVPAAPPSTPALVARGAAVYDAMECGKCHGPDGRGDGPAAHTLEDDRGRRIHPFDMTRRSKQKAGRAPEDLYRVIHTGLDGTPMPSYAASLGEDDTWALVHFVRSLSVDEE
jgi:cytochrome c oxidase cbb3-type subunit 2